MATKDEFLLRHCEDFNRALFNVLKGQGALPKKKTAKVRKPSDVPAFAKTSKNFLDSMRGQQEDLENLLFVIKIVAVDADRAVCDSQYQHCETVKDCPCFAQP